MFEVHAKHADSKIKSALYQSNLMNIKLETTHTVSFMLDLITSLETYDVLVSKSISTGPQLVP